MQSPTAGVQSSGVEYWICKQDDDGHNHWRKCGASLLAVRLPSGPRVAMSGISHVPLPCGLSCVVVLDASTEMDIGPKTPSALNALTR